MKIVMTEDERRELCARLADLRRQFNDLEEQAEDRMIDGYAYSNGCKCRQYMIVGIESGVGLALETLGFRVQAMDGGKTYVITESKED